MVENTRSPVGDKPTFEWLKLDKLYVDGRYQRNTKSRASEANLDHLKKNFSWAYCGALIVCHVAESGKFAVIDGQHRLKAALSRKDIDSMPCMIVKNLDFEKQASSFVAINTKRVKLNSLAAFHAAVAAGDKTAGILKDILDDCDVEIPLVPVMKGMTEFHQMQSPGTLASLVGRYSRKNICWALKVIPEAYGTKKGMMRSSLIKALVELARYTEDLQHDRMVKVLAGLSPFQLEEDARACVSIQGGSTVSAMVQALDRLYRNAGRKNAA